MNWNSISNFYEKQEYRKNELRSFIKSCNKVIGNHKLSSSNNEKKLLLQVRYMSAYIKLLDSLHEILFYGDGIKRAIRHKLQIQYNTLNEMPFNELKKEDTNLLSWSLKVLNEDTQQQHRDCFTELDIQEFSKIVEMLLNITSKPPFFDLFPDINKM